MEIERALNSCNRARDAYEAGFTQIASSLCAALPAAIQEEAEKAWQPRGIKSPARLSDHQAAIVRELSLLQRDWKTLAVLDGDPDWSRRLWLIFAGPDGVRYLGRSGVIDDELAALPSFRPAWAEGELRARIVRPIESYVANWRKLFADLEAEMTGTPPAPPYSFNIKEGRLIWNGGSYSPPAKIFRFLVAIWGKSEAATETVAEFVNGDQLTPSATVRKWGSRAKEWADKEGLADFPVFECSGGVKVLAKGWPVAVTKSCHGSVTAGE
jgi:hypothetical protein